MNKQIETLRGFACLLLVLYHVIGADPSVGLRVADGSLRLWNDGLAYLRMPLFTFLSGMVYGLRPFDGDSRRYLVGKCRRLLIPMLCVGTLFALTQSLTPGTNAAVSNWWLLHVNPVAHFWFIESLFWVFLLVWLAERQRWIASPTGFGLALALACLLYLTVRGSHLFSVDGAIYLLPYFLCALAAEPGSVVHDAWCSGCFHLANGHACAEPRSAHDLGIAGWGRALRSMPGAPARSGVAKPCRTVLLWDLPLPRVLYSRFANFSREGRTCHIAFAGCCGPCSGRGRADGV